MAAVGLSGVFKYGGKFLGYVVAVVLAAGVFVGGGAYFAVTGGVDLGAPSIGSLTTARAVVGVLLVAIGGVISLSGLFGLTHKLLADAATVALSSPVSSSAGDAAAETDEEASSEEADDHEDSETAEDGADSPAEAESPSGSEEPPTDHSRPADAGGDAPSTTDPRSDAPRAASADEPEQTDDFVDESASNEDWTESKYATGTQADASARQDEPAPGGRPAEVNESDRDAESVDDGQIEWTPPDPAEFEQASEPNEAGLADAEPAATDTPVDDAGNASQATDDEVRTWDDVRSASSGNGIEAEGSPRDADRQPHVQDSPTGTEDLVGSDEVTREPAAPDEPNFADRQSGGQSDPGNAAPVTEDDLPAQDDPMSVDDPTAEDDPGDDDDGTLADEGVTSFEVEGDDDPLGDRLSGGD